MKIEKFDPANANFSEVLAMCVKQLKAGKLVAIATETVYGLAGDATNGEAVAGIFEVKQRPQFNPLIAHVSGIEMAHTIGIIDPVSLKLAENFWPGPLTIVVPKNPDSNVHDLVMAGLDTIAIRCPGSNARYLIEAFGQPLAAPSANRSGKVSPTSAAHVVAEFPDEDIIVLDGGDCEVGIESTIVQASSNKITILRVGSITVEELAKTAGIDVEVITGETKITAPGMMLSHYAPRAKVVLDCTSRLPDASMLTFGADNANGDLNLSRNGDLREAASNLYRHLRSLDEIGKDKICVAPIPNTGLGIAINDRLSRAAAQRPGEA